MYIKQSVGQGGKNAKNDVYFIQELINLLSYDDDRIPAVVVDGKAGTKTNTAIYKFQQHIVKLKSPDSRIDPDGRSEKILVSKVVENDPEAIPQLLKKYKITRAKQVAVGSGPRQIQYLTNAKKVVSTYSENIIKLAMAFAGINNCSFSSTIRTFDDQTRIMYSNCKAYPNASSVETLRAARGWGYAAAGRSVEKVYFDNKSKSEAEIKAAMKEKIASLYKEGQTVSLHCVPEADYKKKNVLDIPYGSVIKSKQKDFEIALMGMSQTIKNARHPQPTKGEIYITRLIVEDKCWHIEIAQLNKELPNQKPPAAPKATLKPGQKPSRNYWYSFLDEWF
ncbi:MAG: hypothetical protein OEZ39_08320 [Gammaproteobacteria bacterium]|nr:hypothetical protein [Gammaproteobacteria bacterium]MDH5651866.1 hypothetical protein [Gammaproteobacteria bacterium]